jgi:cyclase
MMQGYDLQLVKSIVDAVSIPVVACGGAGGIPDLKKVLKDGGAHAAAGGSMFVYYGRLKAVLITAPTEDELIKAGIIQEI